MWATLYLLWGWHNFVCHRFCSKLTAGQTEVLGEVVWLHWSCVVMIYTTPEPGSRSVAYFWANLHHFFSPHRICFGIFFFAFSHFLPQKFNVTWTLELLGYGFFYSVVTGMNLPTPFIYFINTSKQELCGLTLEEGKKELQVTLSEFETSSSLKHCPFEGFSFILSNVVIN